MTMIFTRARGASRSCVRWVVCGALVLAVACGEQQDKSLPPLSDTGAGSLPGVGQQGGAAADDRGDGTAGTYGGDTDGGATQATVATEPGATVDIDTTATGDGAGTTELGGTTIDITTGIGTDATLDAGHDGPTGPLTTM